MEDTDPDATARDTQPPGRPDLPAVTMSGGLRLPLMGARVGQ